MIRFITVLSVLCFSIGVDANTNNLKIKNTEQVVRPNKNNNSQMQRFYNACIRVYEKELTFGVHLTETEQLQETVCRLYKND